MAEDQEIDRLKKEIQKIKEELTFLGEDMRSGSLTRQYRDPKNKKGGYWSLSYTYQMRGKTEFVRPESLKQTRKQIARYKTFKLLTARWIDLSLQLCRLKNQPARSL
jgi:ribosomal protein L29